jgi:hypothetical protein
MRNAIVGAFFVSLLSSPSAFAALVGDANNAVVMPDTPSGFGDPNVMVCRAPQRLADNNQFGPKICGYNREWLQLTTHGKDVALDGTTVIDRPMEWSPKGHGNPDAVTCRKPKSLPIPGFNLGPEVCQTNQFWANLVKTHKALDAYGVVAQSSDGLPNTASASYTDPLAGYRMGGN